ncbi:MAG: hypothetical protein AB7L90_19865 [Hyphomicrobiaceae bacterium]
MQHFTSFYEQRRTAVVKQVSANPALDLTADRVGEVIGKAARELNTTPSVKQGYQRICSALIYAFNAMTGVSAEMHYREAEARAPLTLPALLWVRGGLATIAILIGLLGAGTMAVDIACQLPQAQFQQAAPSVPAQASPSPSVIPNTAGTCVKTVNVSQRGPLASALVWLGIIFLALEGFVFLRRMMRGSMLTRWLAPPAWLDPYASVAVPATVGSRPESVIGATELDRALFQAFAELDASMPFFAEPDAVERRIPFEMVEFLQRTASLALQADSARLLREMKNIPALLEIHDLELISFEPATAESFDCIVDETISTAQTTRLAIRQKSSQSIVAKGEAFVPIAH